MMETLLMEIPSDWEEKLALEAELAAKHRAGTLTCPEGDFLEQLSRAIESEFHPPKYLTTLVGDKWRIQLPASKFRARTYTYPEKYNTKGEAEVEIKKKIKRLEVEHEKHVRWLQTRKPLKYNFDWHKQPGSSRVVRSGKSMS